jgi:predicted RNA-binding protein
MNGETWWLLKKDILKDRKKKKGVYINRIDMDSCD